MTTARFLDNFEKDKSAKKRLIDFEVLELEKGRLNLCMLESDTDTIEIALRKRKEELLSVGDIEAADNIESAIRNLDEVSICEE